MQVNRQQGGRWDTNPGNVPPSAITSHDAATGRLTRPDSQSPTTTGNHAQQHACALNVPSADHDSGWDWAIGIAIAIAAFLAVAAVAGWLS